MTLGSIFAGSWRLLRSGDWLFSYLSLSLGIILIWGSFVSSMIMLVSYPFFRNYLKFGTCKGGLAPTPLPAPDTTCTLPKLILWALDGLNLGFGLSYFSKSSKLYSLSGPLSTDMSHDIIEAVSEPPLLLIRVAFSVNWMLACLSGHFSSKIFYLWLLVFSR